MRRYIGDHPTPLPDYARLLGMFIETPATSHEEQNKLRLPSERRSQTRAKLSGGGTNQNGPSPMLINDVIWLEQVVDKIEGKHGVSPEEVEDVLYNRPVCRKAQKGRYKGEDLYYAYGQTDTGRYLFVVFIYKKSRDVLIVTSRDMDASERKRHGRKRASSR